MSCAATQSATVQIGKVTSVIALGELGGTNSATSFRFAVQTVAGITTGLPQTGVAPRPARDPAAPALALVALLALTVFGGGTLAARRPAR